MKRIRTLADAAPILAELRRKILDMSRLDKPEFFRRFLRIEDLDSPGTRVPFALWDAQKQVLSDIENHRLNVILKARQLGFTWLVLGYALSEMLGNEGYRVVATSRTEDEAKELVRRIGVLLDNPALRSVVTPEYAKREAIAWARVNAMEVTITFPNGLESTFTAFPSSAAASRGFTANLIIFDEWAFQQWAAELWRAGFPTINRPTGGKVIGLSTIERGSHFETIFTGAPENGFHRIFVPWYADPRRTQEWYEATKLALGDDISAEYPATIEEALSVPGGAYFPEFDRRVHVVPAEEHSVVRYYGSIDYGLDMLAAYIYEVDSRGEARIICELCESGLIVSAAAAAVIKLQDGRKIDWFAPSDLWNRNRDTGKSTASLFASAGLRLRKTSNGREAGCMGVKEWLRVTERTDEQTGKTYRTAALTINDGAAPELERCLLAIQKHKKHPNEYANEPHSLTHSIDSLRYFCDGNPRPAVEPEKPVHYNFDFEKPKPDAAGRGEEIRVI